MLDLIIIGSGPAGLCAAIYGIRAGLDLLVIEKEYEGTGQIALSNCIDNYLGLPGCDGYSLGEKFREHAVGFGVKFLEAEVVNIGQVKNESGKYDFHYYVVTTADGKTVESKTIVYAAGSTHRKLGAPGEEEFKGRGVSYCATCDGAFYKDKITAVIGGGDTAFDDALYLSGVCKKVYLIHRRNTFRAANVTVEKARKKSNIEFILDSTVSEIIGKERVDAIKVKNINSNEETVLDINGIFIATGSIPSTKSVPSSVKKDQAGYIIAKENGITSTAGFFVAGDVRTKDLRQVITAVSDGANAITSLSSYLNEL